MDKSFPIFYEEQANNPFSKHKMKILQGIIQRFGIELATDYNMSIFFPMEKLDMPSEIYRPGNWATMEYGFLEKRGRVLVSNVAIKELSDLAFEGLGLKSLSFFYVLARAPIENPKLYEGMIKGNIPLVAIDIGSEISGIRKYPNKPMAAFRAESWNYEYHNKTLNTKFCVMALESFKKNFPDYENLIRKDLNFKI